METGTQLSKKYEADCLCLRSYLSGNGESGDPRKVLEILAQRNMEELKLIRQIYRALYNHDFLYLLSQKNNPFATACCLRAREPPERDAEITRAALFGKNLDTNALTEVFCTRSSSELASAKQVYQTRYNSNLERDVSYKTNGSLKEILLAVLNSSSHNGGRAEPSMAMCDAKTFYEAVQSGNYIDQSCVVSVLSRRSTSQIKALLSSYKQLYGHEFMKFLKKSKCGEFGRQLRVVIRCIQFPEKHFAKQLRRALKNGNAREVLIRTVVTRSEVDIRYIDSALAAKTGWNLERLISHEFNSSSSSSSDRIYGLVGDFLVSLLKHS